MSDPVSWLMIEPGWKVAAADGSEAGHVDEVIADEGKDIFSGLAIHTSLLKASKFVPSERVVRIVEGRVELDLSTDEIAALDETR
jgi:uncharacterized protein YrrD